MRTGAKAGTCLAAVLLAASGVAWGDWNPGDGHKMHWPQLPDPNGWDVADTYTGQAPDYVHRHLADDWRCSETGFVEDIHFWGSWKGGRKGIIDHFMISIWADDPAGPGGYFDDNTFSTPLYRDDDGNFGELWYFGVYPGEFTERLYSNGDQGWYDPHTGQVLRNDHTEIYQYNIDLRWLPNKFFQEKDTIYWLRIEAYTKDDTEWGWKTSCSDQFMDDAVYYDTLIDVPDGYPHEGWTMPDWVELYDPLDQTTSLDLAFVITPEPATLGLLSVGVLAMLKRRRR